MFSLQEIRRAHELVLGALRPTPALNWPLLDERLGVEIVVKHENHLPTGAFKVRGGLTYIDALRTEIVGVQSTEAPAYSLSFAAGRVVPTNSADTLADGMATRVPDQDALDVILKGAARIALVSDDEVAAAVRAYWTDAHNLAEGAGAAALAAAVKERSRLERSQGRACAVGRQYRLPSLPTMGCPPPTAVAA